MLKRRLIPLSLCLALGLSAGLAHAAVDKQQAAEIAQGQFRGKVIAVNEDQYTKQAVYRVKILSEKGELHVVIIDMQNGDVIAAH